MGAQPLSVTGTGELVSAQADLAALSEVVAATAALAGRARSQAASALLLRAHARLCDLAAARAEGAGRSRPGGFTPP